MNKEVELRSFIGDADYTRLVDYFRTHAQPQGVDDQVTHYLDVPQDVRIQSNSSYAKIWYKGGKLHDESREEVEIKFAREDFGKMEKILAALGLGVKIKWFRKRLSYDWDGVSVALDDTRGYGKILELEIVTDEAGEGGALERLRGKMAELGVAITPREEFERRFKEYEKDWRNMVEPEV